MPTVEDYFDDDTDMPLPSSSRIIQGEAGMRGALLEEITDDFDMDKMAEQGRGEYGANAKAPPPSTSTAAKGKLAVRDEVEPPAQQRMDPNTPMGGFMGDMLKLQEAEEERLAKIRRQFGNSTVKDPAQFKNWNTLYPLYFDAKVSIADGRRVPRKAALWWPQATQIAHACTALGLQCCLEPEKTHPADWENPGRVKVQLKRADGSAASPMVKNRTQLCIKVAEQMQRANPTLVPKNDEMKPVPTPKPKIAAPSKKDKKSKKEAPKQIVHKLPTRPPQAPLPFPPMDDRFPLHSPLAATGVATAAVKRDIETEKEQKKKGIAPPEEGEKQKMPKMKRMVVRGRR